jgi:hypothetical protein
VDPGSARLSRVQENTLKWRLSLLSSTGYHLGAEMVPHAAALLGVLRRLAAAPSQAVQEGVARALSSILVGLCAYYPRGQYAPCPARVPAPAPAGAGAGADADGVALECYVDKFGNGAAGGMEWHVPSEGEVALANDLLAAFLEAPARELLARCAPGAAPPGREALRSLLLQMEGSLGGVRTCLPDLPGCAKEATPGFAGIAGRLGAAVGSAALRELAARALLAAAAAAAPSDAETLTLCLRVIDAATAAGSAEHADSQASASAWGHDERWLHEPAVAGLLLQNLGDAAGAPAPPPGGDRWRRRRPLWLTAEKVFLNLEWRASQAAYRWHASAARPVLPADAVPDAFRELLAAALRLVVRGLRGVREHAASMTERCLKRYPSLAPAACAPVLAALAKAEDCLALDFSRPASALVPRLREAARGAAARAAAAGGEAEAEAEQALALGGALLLRGNAVWRYVSRDWPAMHALFLAMMASGAGPWPAVFCFAAALGWLMLACRLPARCARRLNTPPALRVPSLRLT